MMMRLIKIGAFGFFAFATAILAGAGVARADEVTHEVQKAAPAATVGVPGTVSITVVGKNGWHVNDEAPITASVKADPSVALPKPKLTRADLAQSTKQSARFDIPFSASDAGKKTITAQTRFVMCQEQACKPVNETVTVEVNVLASAAAATSGGAGAKDKAAPQKKKAATHATP